MPLQISAPKNPILLPFFVIFVIVLIPFTLLFSILRLPFAKKRIAILNRAIEEDWLPLKKYIYINYDESFPLAEFVDREIIPKYGSFIIFDKWSEAESRWDRSEPDAYNRAISIQQDIAGDFDGDSHLLVAVLTPKNTNLNEGGKNILYFTQSTNKIMLNSEVINKVKAQELIKKEIEKALRQWG